MKPFVFKQVLQRRHNIRIVVDHEYRLLRLAFGHGLPCRPEPDASDGRLRSMAVNQCIDCDDNGGMMALDVMGCPVVRDTTRLAREIWRLIANSLDFIVT